MAEAGPTPTRLPGTLTNMKTKSIIKFSTMFSLLMLAGVPAAMACANTAAAKPAETQSTQARESEAQQEGMQPVKEASEEGLHLRRFQPYLRNSDS